MRPALLLLSLISLPSLASDTYLGTINVASGASTNTSSTSNTTAAGATGAITLPTPVAGRAIEVRIQCDVAVRAKTGNGNSTAVTNTGANKGAKIDAEMLYSVFLRTNINSIAVIPASGSGAAACDLFRHVE